MVGRVVAACGLMVVALAAGEAGLGQCEMGWAEGFAARGPDGPVYALAAFDDGSGPALYVGGNFEHAGEMAASNIARWNGSEWVPAGPGTWGVVHAFTVFDDGSGPALHVGGESWPVARWDGQTWTGLNPRIAGTVYALVVYDDGNGPALYAGGHFQKAGSIDVWNIARWDGQAWRPVGGGLFHFDFQTTVHALAVYDDGSGPALYAGGHFTRAGENVQVGNIAKWDGQSWSAVGGALFGAWDRNVLALTVHDDGSGPALYAGGRFEYAGGGAAAGVARWDGLEWTEVGGGVSDYVQVETLAVHDDGGGPALFAGGQFTMAGGQPANFIAKWDGQEWSTLEQGTGGTVYALATYDPPDPGVGPALYVGGKFEYAGEVGACRVARWDGAAWSALGDGLGMSEFVEGLQVYDGGGGEYLYATGEFLSAGAAAASRIARWDGAKWLSIAGVDDGWMSRMIVYDDGTGPGLYVGGVYFAVGGLLANSIARWNGETWSTLDGGVTRGSWVHGEVAGMTVFDDGSGPALFVAGEFDRAGGIPMNNIAKWDGTGWSPLGDGITSTGGMRVVALEVFDDGHGPALYAAGWFEMAGNVPVNNIARWDGHEWSDVGGGITPDKYISTLLTYDDGSGPALYLGGSFDQAGGVPVDNIARWDGTTFSAVGGGMDSWVGALAKWDDGGGPVLCAGGSFQLAGGVPAKTLARWDGAAWSALTSGVDGKVYALCGFPHADRPALYVGGRFMYAGGQPSAYIARWSCVRTPGDTNCDGLVDERDIDPFVWAVVDKGAYLDRYPDCNWLNADLSGDSRVDFGDINPFIGVLQRP